MKTSTNGKLTFWKQKLQEYRKSGLSKKDFSRQIGFNKSTLDYWFARISREKRTRGLVEVKPTSMAILNLPLNVVVADKYRIDLQHGFDPVLFSEVVKILESLK